MHRGRSVEGQQTEMLRRGISLVHVKIILRMASMEIVHQSIPTDLRHDGGRRDRDRQAVPLDDRPLGQRDLGQVDGIEQQEVRRQAKRLERAVHRQAGGVQDVQRIDLGRARVADAHSEGAPENGIKQSFALDIGEELGVVQSGQRESAREDDGGGGNGAGQRPAPGLIEAGDPPVPATTRLCFEEVGRRIRGAGVE